VPDEPELPEVPDEPDDPLVPDEPDEPEVPDEPLYLKFLKCQMNLNR
jgi:hypothetical protein